MDLENAETLPKVDDTFVT